MAARKTYEKVSEEAGCSDCWLVHDKAIDRLSYGQIDYSPWPLLTTFDAAKTFVTCQKYFVCQVIKWHIPERDEGHSMCIVLNK
jgi:hypothetical protein